MPASKATIEAAVKILVEELGVTRAKKIAGRLYTETAGNQSYTATTRELYRALSIMGAGDTDLSARVLALCVNGHVIDAIKLVRTEKGLGLKESKDYVDGVRVWKPA